MSSFKYPIKQLLEGAPVGSEAGGAAEGQPKCDNGVPAAAGQLVAEVRLQPLQEHAGHPSPGAPLHRLLLCTPSSCCCQGGHPLTISRVTAALFHTTISYSEVASSHDDDDDVHVQWLLMACS